MVSYSHHGLGGELFLSCYCGEGLVVSYILIMLLWSGVGCELFSSCCCGEGLVVNYSHHLGG